MKLDNSIFEGDPSTWAGALAIANAYLPHDESTYEHRYNAQMERRLLAVLLVAAHCAGQPNFACVHEMAQKLDDDPQEFSKFLRQPGSLEDNLALNQVLKSVGSLFCEPIKQLLLSLKSRRL